MIESNTRAAVIEVMARGIAPLAWAALGTGDTLLWKKRRDASIEQAERSYTALEASGMAVVPREPTQTMIEAGLYPVTRGDIWRAMLAASPTGGAAVDPAKVRTPNSTPAKE